MKCLRSELYKALVNPLFCLSLAIGTGIALINVVENIQSVNAISHQMLMLSDNNVNIPVSYLGVSLFVRWIAVNGISLGNRIFYFLWPVFAAIPFGWSYSQDKRSGLYTQLVVRSGTKTYFFSKYLAVFISGGLAVSIPVLLNLLINATICPYYIPNVMDFLVAVFDGSFMSKLFYTHPWVHGLVWCGVDFLFGGVTACLCFLVGSRLRLQVMVMLTPFAFFLLLDGLYSILRNTFIWNVELSPLALASMVPGWPNPEWAVFSVLGILVVLSLSIGYWQMVRYELE